MQPEVLRPTSRRILPSSSGERLTPEVSSTSETIVCLELDWPIAYSLQVAYLFVPNYGLLLVFMKKINDL